MVITRFAPSPTGLLHLGHIFAARVAQARAEAGCGEFLLRFEDIDHTRAKPEFADSIEDDLRWLGLSWKGEALYQSRRLEAYRAAFEKLRARDVVYPCFCTRREIQSELGRSVSAPHGPEGPLYPGTCRHLSIAEQVGLMREKGEPAWRLHAGRATAATGSLDFRDETRGVIDVKPGLLGDVILLRRDIATSYHLAVVVDDAFQKISHVTRGEDLMDSTHVHRLLQALLGFPTPTYLHHQLIRDKASRRLAKRDRAATVRSLRENGANARDVLAMLPPALPRHG